MVIHGWSEGRPSLPLEFDILVIIASLILILSTHRSILTKLVMTTMPLRRFDVILQRKRITYSQSRDSSLELNDNDLTHEYLISKVSISVKPSRVIPVIPWKHILLL